MILVEDSISKIINDWFQDQNYSSVFVLVDENTKEKCLPLLNFKNDFVVIEIKSGEKNKNLDTCSFIWSELLKNKANRKSLLINIGGGVICDMGGFCASTFKRGIDFINIPTTLLAMTDASVGSKTGVDFQGQKNMIGLFSDAKEIFIDTKFLKTLSERELLSGFAEVLKHGLIKDEKYFDYCISNFGNLDWLYVVQKSIEIKSEIVSKDPKEKGLRKILNFGHTFGHAYETYSLLNHKNPLLHGEAVVLGMISSIFLSVKYNFISNEVLDTILEKISSIYSYKNIENFDTDILFEFIKNDKKNDSDAINYILLEEIGKANYNFKVSKDDFIESFDFLKKSPLAPKGGNKPTTLKDS